MTVEFVDMDWGGRGVCIEYQWIGAAAGPPLVFLHEGLGSRAMWRDFPARLCAAAGLRGMVYSRPAYGQSTPRQPGEIWNVDFMHRQAYEVLPALLEALNIREMPWLVGHSDGASIALLYAARYPAAGAIVLAPHIRVEELTVTSIEKARVAYETTDLPRRLGRYHADPDSAFWGWNRIWLDPSFRDWNIEDEIRTISCPVLAVQGLDDEYGTLEQIRGIARQVPGTQLLELANCGHAPHKDQPDALIDAAVRFIHAHMHNDARTQEDSGQSPSGFCA